MSITLTGNGTDEGVEVRNCRISSGNIVVIDGKSPNICISMEDFCITAEYVLTGSDLSGSEDPRLELIRRIKKLRKIKGWNKGEKRLEYKEAPIDSKENQKLQKEIIRAGSLRAARIFAKVATMHASK